MHGKILLDVYYVKWRRNLQQIPAFGDVKGLESGELYEMVELIFKSLLIDANERGARDASGRYENFVGNGETFSEI